MEVDDQTMEDKEDKVKKMKMSQTYTVARNKIAGAASANSNHDDSLIVIPDTPSPVFSRFAGKRERFPDLDRSRLDFVRKKPKTSNDTSQQLNLHPHNSSQSIYDISSQKGTGSSTDSRNLSKNNGEFSPNLSTKYFKNSHHDFEKDKNKNESDESSKYFKNLWDECMQDADTATKTIVKSPKKLFKLKNRRKLLNFDNDELYEEKESESKFAERSKNQKSRIETVTQDMDVDISHGSRREALDSGLGSTNQDKETFSNTRQNPEESGISNKFAKLKMARQKKMDRLLDRSDSGSSDEFLQLPAPQRKSSPKGKFNNLCWPSDSESESDSDNSDTVPLREILGENISKKKKSNLKNLREQSVKNKTSVHNSVARGDKNENSGRNHFAAKKDVKEKYFSSPKLATKNFTVSSKRNSSDLNKQESWCSEGQNVQMKDRVRNLSEPDVSIVSVSSTDSHTLAGDRSHDLTDTSHDQNEDVEDIRIITAPEFSLLPQDGRNSFRPSFVSPRLPVPISIRRGRHADRRPDRYIDDVDLTPSVIISSQVQPSSNVSPPARDLRSVSPHLPLNRTRSVRSHKGRLSRPPRNVILERVTSPGTDFTTASALMSPGLYNSTQQIRQHEADEDFARRLQEEMDMEFALSLHNMENRPPAEHASSGATTTTDEDSDTRIEQANARSRMYGLEDIEAFLHMSEDVGPTSNLEQMLRASMTTTPPRTRNRQRGSRRQRNNNNSLEALNRMEAHLMSILDEYGTPPVRGQGRRGRRFFTSPAEEGQDYEELLNLAEMIGEVKHRGLTKHQLTKLPERKYQLCPGEDVKECLVCMSEFEDKDKLRILPCFHEFHTPCIDKWITGNATCPVCRVEVRV